MLYIFYCDLLRFKQFYHLETSFNDVFAFFARSNEKIKQKKFQIIQSYALIEDRVFGII